MSSAGLGGRSDTDRTNTSGNDAQFDPNMMPESAATDETLSDVSAFGDGEPAGVIEIVEIETTGDDLDALGLEPAMPRFRWWYVPAVALPVAAGATAGAIWLSRRNRSTRQPVAMYNALAKQGRSMLDQVRSSRNTRKAARTWQQGLTSMRESAKGLPDQASALRDKSAEALAAVDLAALLDQTRGIWSTALDQMSNLWERNAPAAKEVSKRANKTSMMAADMMRGQAAQIGRQLAGLRKNNAAATGKGVAAARAAQAAAMSLAMQNRINRWMAQQRGQRMLATARGKTVAPIASAARSTSRSVQKTGKSVNRGFKQARAFSFGLLVATMVTYIRVWRNRLDEREVRETAGGRMVRDPKGQVEAGALLP